MVRTVILILTCVQLSLVEGLDSSPVIVKNETTTDFNKRILYGQLANRWNYPFMVKLRMDYTGFKCGGSIIASHWIMIASHCTRPFACNEIQIFPGVWRNGESVYAADCYYHELYRTGTYEYDISLLRVGPNILRDGRAAKVSLPSPGTHFPAGTPATFVGWGETERGTYPLNLLYANTVLLSWNTCNALNNLPYKDIPIRTVCTLGLGPAPSSNCFGDSGGPLLVNGLAIGIFSTLMSDQTNRCIPGYPSMFTSVVDYLPWIFNIVDPITSESSHYSVTYSF